MSGGVDHHHHQAWSAGLAAVSWACGAEPAARPARQRGPCGTRGDSWRRKLAVYTASCGLGVPQRALERCSGLDFSTIHKWLVEIEDQREPGGPLDLLLDALALHAKATLARKAAA